MTQERVLLARPTATTSGVEQSADAKFRSDLARSAASGYRLASVILSNSADAEDATQDALERAWRGRSTLRDSDRFEAWFQRILVNSCRDHIRHRRAGPIVLSINEAPDAQPIAPATHAVDPLAATIAQDTLRREFVRLNVDQRIVVAMRFYLDLEVDEIARRLGTRPGTIKSRLHRALKTLRNSWEGHR